MKTYLVVGTWRFIKAWVNPGSLLIKNLAARELEQAVSDLDTAAITGNNNNIRIHWLDVSIADSPVAINDTESLIPISSAALDNDISTFKWSNGVRAVCQGGR